MSLTVIVPVFNSEKSLPILIQRLEPVLDPDGEFEVILVNDGSCDESWGVIRGLVASYPWIRGINLMRN
jgi:glycosyltransferase involved in cell wall biosynthesis